jgi:hypothetical protein
MSVVVEAGVRQLRYSVSGKLMPLLDVVEQTFGTCCNQHVNALKPIIKVGVRHLSNVSVATKLINGAILAGPLRNLRTCRKFSSSMVIM